MIQKILVFSACFVPLFSYGAEEILSREEDSLKEERSNTLESENSPLQIEDFVSQPSFASDRVQEGSFEEVKVEENSNAAEAEDISSPSEASIVSDTPQEMDPKEVISEEKSTFAIEEISPIVEEMSSPSSTDGDLAITPSALQDTPVAAEENQVDSKEPLGVTIASDQGEESGNAEEKASSSNFDQRQEASCNTSSRSNQFWIRHTEPKGVGFNDGYTTLQGFVMGSEAYWKFFPYIDARWHIFNNGKNAANIGVGARGEVGKRFFGANIYYDYRKVRDTSFNQVSFGFETIGRRYDIYANGYIVVGDKNTDVYGSRFYRFHDHYLYLKGKTQGAFSGFDASVRVHLLENQKWDCYVDAGPYYYHSSAENLFGGKAGFGAILADYFFAEGTVSYDHIFKWIGQAIGGVRFPLGSKTKIESRGKSCKDQQVLASRLMQIPKHNEIIVVNERNSIDIAINPATNQPYFFWFVNNLSSSLGTYESPYPTLAQAQVSSSPYDIIYTYTGDGTTSGMNAGITLQNLQQFWGAGITHNLLTTHGEIVVPALDVGYPLITNPAGAGVVLANSNLVSGIHIDQTQTYGITGVGVREGTILNNIITSVNTGGGGDKGGIDLVGPGMGGTYYIVGNTIEGTSTDMVGIFLTPKEFDICSANIWQNHVNTKQDGAEVKSLDSSRLTSSISSNTFSSTTQYGIYISHEVDSIHTFSLVGSVCSAPANSGCWIEGKGGESFGSGTVSYCQFINSDIGLQIQVDAQQPRLACDIIGNTFTNNANRHLQAQTVGNNQEILCLKIIKNVCTTTATSADFFLKNESFNRFNLIEFSDNTPNTYVDGTTGDPIFTSPICPFPGA